MLCKSSGYGRMYSAQLTYLLRGRQQCHDYSHRCGKQLWGEVSTTALYHIVLWKSSNEELSMTNAQQSCGTCDEGLQTRYPILVSSCLPRLRLKKKKKKSITLCPLSLVWLSKQSFQVQNNFIWKCALSAVIAAQRHVWYVFLPPEDWCTDTPCTPQAWNLRPLGGS